MSADKRITALVVTAVVIGGGIQLTSGSQPAEEPGSAPPTSASQMDVSGAEDDGDGGHLSATEEQQIKDWFTEVTSGIRALDAMGDTRLLSQSQRDERLAGMHRLAAQGPPSLTGSEADAAFQGFWDAMGNLFAVHIEIEERSPRPGLSGAEWDAALRETFMGSGIHEALHRAEQGLGDPTRVMWEIIERDFADDPEGLTHLRTCLEMMGLDPDQL